ncbi:hypothetical protein [Athalassotoga saccharophila]|nr:hypothetical protein [Athalassotoga saccharophila]BBJ28215.1 hypothetical protein ATHSA_1118 [Athalassotoga saccharophila]
MDEEIVAIIISAIMSYEKRNLRIVSVREIPCSRWVNHTPYVFWRVRKG